MKKLLLSALLVLGIVPQQKCIQIDHKAFGSMIVPALKLISQSKNLNESESAGKTITIAGVTTLILGICFGRFLKQSNQVSDPKHQDNIKTTMNNDKKLSTTMLVSGYCLSLLGGAAIFLSKSLNSTK